MFLAYQEHDRAFEELYCTAYRLLDETFQRDQAGYMDFPAVYDRVQDRLRRILELGGAAANGPAAGPGAAPRASISAAPSNSSSDGPGADPRARRDPRPLSFHELHALLGWKL